MLAAGVPLVRIFATLWLDGRVECCPIESIRL